VHGRTPVDEVALLEFLRDPERYPLPALDGPRVVGGLSGRFPLYEIDPLPQWRNRGIGKALVESVYAHRAFPRPKDDDVMVSVMLPAEPDPVSP